MNAVTISADQIVPIGQRLARVAQNVRTGRWQPFEVADFALSKAQTIGHKRSPVLVVAAQCGFDIEQFARDVGRVNPAGLVVFDLVQAAFAAAVAQCLPLSPIECFERGLPEWLVAQVT